jgi:Raf kinase inhibitor-like YbhB/YbcL family protein
LKEAIVRGYLPLIVLVSCLLMAVPCGCQKETEQETEPAGEKVMAFQITSSAFEEGGTIPTKYTCDGPDLSPPLMWSGAPERTKSFALVCDDPDAPMGTWVHWVIYNIPGDTTGLPEGVAPDRTLQSGARQGMTDFKRVGYGGPCPPRGPAHRYYFKLYALDSILDLDPGKSKKDLLGAMKGHILGEAQLMGRYGR